MQAAFDDHFRLAKAMNGEDSLAAKFLLKQILNTCDRKTRAIIWGRIEGRSWDEISYDVVMSNHAARLHYSKSLRRIRDVLKTGPRQYIEKMRLAEREERKKSRFISLWKTVTALLYLRVLCLKDIWAVRLRITYREKEDILAEVDTMLAWMLQDFKIFSLEPTISIIPETLLQKILSIKMRGILAGNFSKPPAGHPTSVNRLAWRSADRRPAAREGMNLLLDIGRGVPC